MGRITDALLGKRGPATTPAGEFHHSSVLADIILANNLQNGGSYNRALGVSAVYRGQQILADSMARFPWFEYSGGPHSGSRQVTLPERRDEIPTVLVQPDPLMSRGDWVRYLVTSLVMRGNAYLLGSMYVDGHPTRVQVLNPDQVTVQWADEARTIRDYRWGVDQPLPRFAVRHLALSLQPSALLGLGPIDAIRATIDGQLTADQWARDLFTSSGTPSGKLIHPGKLSKDEAADLAAQWDSSHQGNRRTGVLSGGMDFEPISLTPDQAQFLQTRSFGIAEIARALGIPSHILNAAVGVAGASGSSMTYTNVRDIWLELLNLTLEPVYGERIAEAMSSYRPRGRSVMFDYSDFVRQDTETRYRSYAMAQDNWLTTDEIRAAEGLAPSPELEAETERKRQVAEAISGGTPQEGNDDAGEPAEAVSTAGTN